MKGSYPAGKGTLSRRMRLTLKEAGQRLLLRVHGHLSQPPHKGNIPLLQYVQSVWCARARGQQVVQRLQGPPAW